MALKRSKKKAPEGCPDPSRIQQLTREAMNAMKEVHASLQRDTASVQEERERVDTQMQDFEQNQSKMLEMKNEIEMQRNEMSSSVSEMDSMKTELQNRENEIFSRTQQLDADMADQANIRDSLATLQEQLNRDQEEIAVHREELMQRLGATTKTAKTSTRNKQAVSVDETTHPDEDLVAEESEPKKDSPKKASPKPASGADQFRKLRRDAKRKAIGA